MLELIQGIVDSPKKIICVSLLTPCNKAMCSEVAKSLIKKAAPGLDIFFKEAIVLKTELGINKISDKVVVVSIPLSMNRKFGLGIYDHAKHRESLSPGAGGTAAAAAAAGEAEEPFPNIMSTEYSNEPLLEKIYGKIDMTTEDSSIKSIIDFAKYYYDELHKDYVLAYHCKSGKDRTSVFDAIVQATIYYCSKNEGAPINYAAVKVLTGKMLVFGLMISYYGTGGIGLKLGTIPMAKTILGPKYDKFMGNSKDFMKSA
jgi:hypothetical protein